MAKSEEQLLQESERKLAKLLDKLLDAALEANYKQVVIYAKRINALGLKDREKIVN